MRKKLCFFTVTLMMVAFGMSTHVFAAGVKLTIGTSATSQSIIGQTMQHFADKVKELSGGEITVATYPDSQMGSDTELIEGVQMGTISMVIGTTAPQVSFVPTLALFDLPNAYSDINTAQKVLGQFNDKMEPSFSAAGLHLCTMFPTAFRYMSSNKAVRGVNDFQGIKIRTMENPYHMAYWKSLGATATPLAFSELYIGLQQGTIDAQENPLDIFMSAKFNEQQKYIIDTKHIVFIADILINKGQWNALSDAQRNILDQAFQETSAFGTSNAKSIEAKNRQAIKASGVEIIELDDATIAAMKKEAAPVYDMIRKAAGAELVDEYLNAINSAQ